MFSISQIYDGLLYTVYIYKTELILPDLFPHISVYQGIIVIIIGRIFVWTRQKSDPDNRRKEKRKIVPLMAQ